MPYVKLSEDGKVVGVFANEQIDAKIYMEPDDESVVAYLSPDPTQKYKIAFDSHLDAVAQSRAYDNRLTIATYATSTNPAYAVESQAFIAWRDEALASMFDQLAEVQGGGEPPTVEEFIANLPVIQWPEEVNNGP